MRKAAQESNLAVAPAPISITRESNPLHRPSSGNHSAASETYLGLEERERLRRRHLSLQQPSMRTAKKPGDYGFDGSSGFHGSLSDADASSRHEPGRHLLNNRRMLQALNRPNEPDGCAVVKDPFAARWARSAADRGTIRGIRLIGQIRIPLVLLAAATNVPPRRAGGFHGILRNDPQLFGRDL